MLDKKILGKLHNNLSMAYVMVDEELENARSDGDQATYCESLAILEHEFQQLSNYIESFQEYLNELE